MRESRPLFEGSNMKGLYLVTLDWDDTDKLLDVTERALQGGASLVQYRHKTADRALRQVQAERLLALCRRDRCPFVVNDHLELCRLLDADGLHVGATNDSAATARAALGPTKIIGVSCYGSLDRARAAHQAGASYVALGGFYPSRVKKYPVTTQIDIIAQAKVQIPLPCVVIGGRNQQCLHGAWSGSRGPRCCGAVPSVNCREAITCRRG